MKKIIKNEQDLFLELIITGHNGVLINPNDFQDINLFIYTTNRLINVLCTFENKRLQLIQGRFMVVVEASDLQNLDFGQLRWKLDYSIFDDAYPDNFYNGCEFGGMDLYLTD
jgi:hypothetical protein